MLQGLAKAKALKELQTLLKDKASLNGLALAKALKRQNELRIDLGMGKAVQDEPIIKTPLNIDEKQTPKERRKAVESWLKENLQGKTITTVDGKKVRFNRNKSVDHIMQDVFVSKKLIAQAVTHIADVFTSGEFIGRELPYKQRQDKFVAFHVYRKWVQMDNYQAHLQVKAGELDNGLLEAGDGLIAYTVKDMSQFDAIKNSIKSIPHWQEAQLSGEALNAMGHFLPSIKSMDLNGELALDEHSNTLFDGLQEMEATLTILQVLDENGNDVTDDVLGDGKSALNDDEIERLSQIEIDVQDNSTKGERKRTAKEWMKENLLGKSVRTVDNKLVHFNSNDTINHISFNAMRSRNSLIALCIPFIPAIFAKGEFVGRETPNHGRVDETIQAFHLYRKWVELKNGYKVNAEVQACERKGERELFYSAYNLKALNKIRAVLPSHHNDNSVGTKTTNARTSTALDKAVFDSLLETGLHHADQAKTAFDYYNVMLDKMQDDVEMVAHIVPLRILQVLDENGRDITDEVLGGGQDGNDKIPQNSQPFNRSNIKIPKSIKARQNANNQAMAILDRLDGGELSVDDLTDDDKAVLAKYSGNGGGLIGRDGKKGSDYEYYTPHELASGMWDLAKELGFDGGRVLDPCAGTGVFTATSPDNVLMDNIELDETSGRINQILNDGVRAKTTVSPFEKVVNGYDDGDDETGFDLVMSNVPFGNNAARGANKMYDKAYQDASLDYYFILRSLEKLKSGGLAVLMTAPSTVQGKRAREIELRQKTSRIAEFIGAYRLPNSMFTDTGADVSVDVMVFKKFNQSMIETVQNHYDNGNIELLQQANVLWDDYLSGHYFKKHPKNVLGTIQKAKNRFGDDIEVVQSELSKSQIAKLMVKLGGSRIDWDLLNATEAKPITYQDGDVVYRAGVQYQYQHGTWQEMTQAGDDIRHHDTLAKLQDNAMNVSYDDIKTALAYFAKKGVVNEQINDAKVLLSNIKDGVEWRIYHTSKAIDSVLANGEIGANFKEIYPGLSDEMRDVVVLAKGRYQGMIGNALKNIKLHYNKGDYSDVWNGNIQTQHDTLEVTGTLSAKIAKLQYNNKSKYLSIDEFKAIAPDVDLMTDDDYFITKDGKQVILAQDFLVGNCKERLDELNRWIDECDDEALKTKLSRQYVMASLQIPNVDIYKASFDLLSPQIPMSFKMDFLNSVMPIKVALDGKGLKMVGQAKSNSEKIANRILYNINGNRLTLGGIELTDKGEKMNEKQALKLLNETFLQYNAQFKSWVKANDTLIDLLDAKINSLDNCYFSQNDDEGEIDIHGFNVKLHGYQNAFVRQQGRSFGGLNGFGVGLGKTFTSLASVQHTHNIGAKNKTIFVVPKSVLSNWRKEAMKAYANLDDCLFVGLREVRGKMVAKSSEYDADLQKSLSREYRKIFMTQEAFARIKLQDDTLDGYFAHLAQNDDIYNAQESE